MFDDIIKDKANEHEAPVPPGTWDNIVKKKKKRRFAFWWWGGALLLFTGMAGYFVYQNNREETTVIAENKTSNSDNSTAIANNENNNTTATAEGNRDKEISNSNTTEVIPGSKEESNSVIIIDNGKPANKIAAENENQQGNKNNTAVAYNKPSNKKIKGRYTLNQQPGIADDKVAVEITTGKADETENNQTEEDGYKKNTTVKNEKPNNENNNTTAATKETTENKKLIPVETNESKKNNSTQKTGIKKSWFIDAGITPVLALHQYDAPVSFNRTVTTGNNFTIYTAQLVKTSIDPAVAFSLTVRRELNKKITAGIGLQYLLLKENISIEGKEINTIYNTVQRLVNGTLINDTVETTTEGNRTIKAVNGYHLFSIPVFLQYSFIQKKRWSISATGGVNINVSGTYYNEINRNTNALLLPTPATGSETNIGYDVFAGLRLGKAIGNKLELFTMPSIWWGIGNYTLKNSLINRNTRQACVGFGLSYKIN